MTKIINLYGGPGCGKSTTAAGVYARLKSDFKSVELVREYVKNWAWRGEKVSEWDELYLFAKQLRAESAVYGKVDYIVTDRPLGLSCVYEAKYQPLTNMMLFTWNEILKKQKNNNIENVNFLVKRLKPYDNNGRYESEKDAKFIDELCLEMIPNLVTINSIDDIIKVIYEI